MAVTKKEADGEHPADHYLVVEDPQQPGTWHLRVHDTSGKLDHGLMGAAWAALHGGYRGNKYEGPQKQKAIEELKGLYADEKIPTPGGGMGELDGKWIEVFRAGDYGENGKYGREDLDKIVANYDRNLHEAPFTIGHPESDSPAYGWVAAVRRNGDLLEAQGDQVDPGFEDLLKGGKFKKRSIAIYKDLGGKGLYLRHLGFLGAQPPAVKGLKSLFHDADSNGYVEIGDPDNLGTEKQEELMEKDELKKTFGEVLREWAESVGLVKKADPAAGKTFSEAEVVAREKVAADAAKAAIEKEFAEKEKAETAKAGRKTQIREFIERLKPLGKWIPAFDKLGLVEFMEALPAEQTIEFGEEGKKEKKSAVEIFQKFLEVLPKIVEFGELAGDRKPLNSPAEIKVVGGIRVDLHSVRLAERVEALRKANSKLTFEEAAAQARTELGETAAMA